MDTTGTKTNDMKWLSVRKMVGLDSNRMTFLVSDNIVIITNFIAPQTCLI